MIISFGIFSLGEKKIVNNNITILIDAGLIATNKLRGSSRGLSENKNTYIIYIYIYVIKIISLDSLGSILYVAFVRIRIRFVSVYICI